MWLGQVKEIEGSEEWPDVAMVAAWVCEEEVVAPRSIEWDGDQWQPWVQGQAWRRTGVEWKVEAGNLWPVIVMATELEHKGGEPTRVVIDKAWGQVVEGASEWARMTKFSRWGTGASAGSTHKETGMGNCWEWRRVVPRDATVGRS